MPTSEKTYTFRAPADLAPRIRDAFVAWHQFLDARQPSEEEVSQAMRVLFIRMLRQARELDDRSNQSALLRAAIEVFVEAAEKVSEDLEYVRQYEEWALEDEEASRIRRGALRAAADRWRDE